MWKKLMIGSIAVAFVCSSLLLMASCAKKQVQVSQGLKSATEETVTVTVTETEIDRARKEAERQAKLAETERIKALAEEISLFESENIYFDFDRANLKSEAKANLKIKAEWLRRNPAYSVRIAGNGDNRGTAEYNLALGERRAQSAKKFLRALGISGDRISTISYGEERPADPRNTEEAWSKNRRDDFTLTK